MQVLDGKTGKVLGCVTDDTTTTIEIEREREPSHPYNLVFNPELLSFSQAEAHCVGLGGHLATVSSKAMAEYIDATFIRPAEGECRPAWIGFTDRDNEGSWTWTGGAPPSTGTAGPFTNWWGEEPNNCALSRACNPGPPEDGDEDCVSLAVDCVYAPHWTSGSVGDAWTDSGCEPGDFEYYPRASVCQVPTSEHAFELEQCKARCKAAGYCCNDPDIGSNQLLSCAQACMIRARGTAEGECKAVCHEQDVSRGCFREVNGHTYSMCQSCADLDDTCPHGVQEHSHACHAGCAVAKERETCDFEPKDTCGGPGELCFYDPSCSDASSPVYFGGLGCNAGGAAWNCRYCGFTTAGGVSYPNCPIAESPLCLPTAHYNRTDLYSEEERARTALICR